MRALVAAAAGTAGSRRGRCSSRLFGFLLSRFGAAALEIGGVPAATVELEAGRGKLLGKRSLAAFGAIGQIGLADLAHDFLLEATARALVIVDWHKRTSVSNPLKNKIIPEAWAFF